MGSRPKTLIMVYRSLIRSASSRKLESLESVSNKVMRISSGCFKSTPITSLQVTTEEPPLQIRNDKLSPKDYYKVKGFLQNPAFNFITPEQETL